MMKKWHFLASTILCVQLAACTSSTIVTGQAYLPAINDVPLPDNFSIIEESESTFDGPFGRIIHTQAYSDSSSVLETHNFYTNSLPELGWKIDKNTANKVVATRETEVLEIYLKSDNSNSVLINYELSPKQ